MFNCDSDNYGLSGLDEAFEQAECAGTPVPDNKYEVVVDKIEMSRSKISRDPMLTWWLRIEGPTHSGRILFKKNVISEKSLKFLKGDLKRCGVELFKLSELPGRLKELLDLRLSVTKKTEGEYERVYINRRLAAAAPKSVKGLSEDGLGRF